MEGDPGIWHRSFWLSAVTLNEHKSQCALLLPLISSWLAISSVRVSGALVCAGRLIRHAQKKYDVKSTLLTHKVQKKIAILWKVLSTTPLLRQLHACIWNAD